jgi:hypothetical protein
MPHTILPVLLFAVLAACQPLVADREALLPPAELKVTGGRHCSHCGRIEAKVEIAPRVYEYTLRMADGSSSVFQETLPTTWRIGERVGVM